MTQPLSQPELGVPLLIERRASVVEAIGRWLALVVALTTIVTLLWVGFPWRRWEPTFENIATRFVYWGVIFVGTAIVTGILSIVPRWLPRQRPIRWVLLVVVVVGAAALGGFVQSRWDRFAYGEDDVSDLRLMQQHTLVVLAILLAAIGEFKLVDEEAEAAVHEAELKRVQVQAGLAAVRLQVLQAQIEPHFIFNSLANVRRLLRTDGPAGRAMLADVLRYLESALPQLRENAPTLGRELQLARAYLAVHQVRMGPRLRIELDIESRLLDRPVPPMMLLTLVENALKHGLGPLVEGGTITIRVREDADGRLVLAVADTGAGLTSTLGHGTGLANIRARLRSMYDQRARLTLEVNEPRGVIAAIELPAPT